MKQCAAGRLARWREASLAVRAAGLTIVVVLLYAAVAPVGWHLRGPTGLTAAAAAAGVCWLGATLALVVSHLLRGPSAALYGLLFGMALRMGVPMIAALILHVRRGALAEAGVLYYLLVFYPVTLGVETALSLPKIEPASRPPEGPRDVS